MKKSLILISLVLALSATGCTKQAPTPPPATEAPVIENTMPPATPKATEKPEPEEGVVEKVELSLGTKKDNVYESEFLGIGIKLPEGWNFYSDEQTNELNGIKPEMSPEETDKIIQSSPLVYDMVASNQGETLNTITISIENLNASKTANYDEIAYVEMALENLPKFLAEQMGATDIKVDAMAMQFTGEERASVEASAQINNNPLFQKQVAIKVGNYMASVTVITADKESALEVLSNFYPLKK